jgi:vesicle-associated membrane protein-associated protein A
MSKQEQVLILDPPTELRFKGPFTDVSNTELKLQNPSAKQVLFKVKTTAPKRYCVRPNSGLIEPGSYVTVSVMLQPFDHDSSEKNKHKFMVQSMFAPDGVIDNQDLLWKEASAEQLMDSKLKCVFEQPANTAQNINFGHDDVIKPVYNKNVSSSAQPTVDRVASSPAKTSDNKQPDLQKLNEECRRLNLEIRQLKEENETLRAEGLRLRKVAHSETVASTPQLPTVKFPSALPPQSPSVPHVLFLVAMAIVGLLIGKLLL